MSLPIEPSFTSSFAAGTFVADTPSAATSSAPMKPSCQVDQAGQSAPSSVTSVPSSLVVTSASLVVTSASYLVVEVAYKLAFTPFAQALPASLACPHLVRLAVHPYSTASHLVLVLRSWEPHNLPTSPPMLNLIYPKR